MFDVIVFYILKALLAVCRRLGPVAASDLGARLARAIGPWLPVSRVGDRNLRLIMPHLSRRERRRIIGDVWDNLGRTIGELPHLGSLDMSDAGPGFVVDGASHLQPGPAIYASAHFGNWEALPAICARYGAVFSSFYRAANNRQVDALILRLRRAAVRQDIPLFAKGTAGAHAAARHLAKGGALGILVDQKLNEGLELPFLGKPAMTSAAAATLALHYRCPIILGRIVREGPARLRLIVEPPIVPRPSNDRTRDVEALTRMLNDKISDWVLANPGAWLWLHRRWPRARTG